MQPWDFILIALSAIAIHRLWIHEDIFERPRRWCLKIPSPLDKPLLCPPCFAFWAGVVAYTLRIVDHQYLHGFGVGSTEVLSLYPLVRASMALPVLLVKRGGGNMAPDVRNRALEALEKRRAQYADTQVVDEMQTIIDDIDTDATERKKPCSTCGEQKKQMKERLEALRGPVLVIASPLHAMIDSYSLCTAIAAQARAAVSEGFTVMLVVQEDFDIKTLPEDWDGNPHYILVPMLPTFQWQEDTINEEMAERIAADLKGLLTQRGSGLLITHDMLFQSWYTTHAEALHRLGEVEGWTILHTLHSMASRPDDLEKNDPRLARCTLPKGHKLICLSHSAAAGVANAYQTDLENILVLPNAFDLLDWFGSTRKVRHLVESNGVLDADVVQTYPISMPRMGAKGVLDLMWIFAAMKKQGVSVRLILADAHGDEDLRTEVHTASRAMDLTQEVIFATDYVGDRAIGVGRSDLRVLMQVSNVFIFPSRSEVCPLSLMEAAWAGNLLVLNATLPVMRDLVGSAGVLWYGFGSTTQAVKQIDADDVAKNILSSLQSRDDQRVRKALLRHTGPSMVGKELLTIHRANGDHKSLVRRVNGVSVEGIEE